MVKDLEKLNLGLSRDNKVELKSCFSDWQKAFEIEKARLSSCLNDSSIEIHHIGSTSIPSILAKPILDILIVVPSIETLDLKQQNFEALGYEYKGEYGIQGRRYCVLYNFDKTIGYVHIHSFQRGHSEVENHLLFRNYLIAHPERAASYQNLKLDLLKRSNVTRTEYTQSKSLLIQEILNEAKTWNCSN
jgi:GrpB-like predicted nucleotidyltransferase (UPF0157 family)